MGDFCYACRFAALRPRFPRSVYGEARMIDPRMTKLADVLINYSTALQPGEKILIEAIDAPVEMTCELIRVARAAGGDPLVTLKSNRVNRALMLNSSESQMDLIAQTEALRMSNVDAYIRLGNILIGQGDVERGVKVHEGLSLRRNLKPFEEKAVYGALAAFGAPRREASHEHDCRPAAVGPPLHGQRGHRLRHAQELGQTLRQTGEPIIDGGPAQRNGRDALFAAVNEAIAELAASEGYDLQRSYAYSDSITDLPLLDLVGHPARTRSINALPQNRLGLIGHDRRRITQADTVTDFASRGELLYLAGFFHDIDKGRGGLLDFSCYKSSEFGIFHPGSYFYIIYYP